MLASETYQKVNAEAMDKNVLGGDGELLTHYLLSLLCARH